METRPTLIGVLAGALLIAVLAIGALGANLLMGPGRAQAQTVGVTGMRQITVVGTGESRIKPDMATVQIGVETAAATSQEALAQNTAQANAIIEQIKQLGVEEKDIQTSNFNIYPNYDTNGRQITGYTVSNMVSVTIRSLDSAGDLLDKVVQAGANRIYGVSFGVADTNAVMAQARDAAVADARARADLLAKAGGATVGQLLVITESIGSQPPLPVLMGRAEAAQAADSAVPIQSGEQVFSAQVQVTYELR